MNIRECVTEIDKLKKNKVKDKLNKQLIKIKIKSIEDWLKKYQTEKYVMLNENEALEIVIRINKMIQELKDEFIKDK